MHQREKYFKNLIFVFFVISCIWILIQLLAPLSLPSGSFTDLSGQVIFVDNEEDFRDMPYFTGMVYKIGDILCHQKPQRSFFVNGNQMPFCSRCTAIWLGLAIGFGFMIFYKIELNEKFLLFIFLCFIPIGIDGIGQLFSFWESTNFIRLITGLLTGFVVGLAISVIFDELKTFNILKKIKK